jgi:signal transduction histidine kinase/response regulator of citrate/malate metabolism
VKREAILTRSSANAMRQILTILKKVEKETLVQTALNNKLAKDAVKNSIMRISLIMLAFFILTALLVYFILRDISRINNYRKKLELAKDEAEYHSLAKQRFLANMSHEIRTPLQSIIGYAEIIKQQEHPQKKDVEAIYRSSGHLLQIVNEVLDYNRIISGKFTFVKEVFNMKDLLDEVISILHMQAEKKGIVLRTDYDNSVLADLNGDSFRLKQVLYNLLGNAIKFTHEGEVVLSIRGKWINEDIHYQFDVTDTGVGLSASDIDRIFNEFEQAEDEKQAHTGTGLGLAITKELITGQGGNISVESKPGQGSSFIFDLSFAKAELLTENIEHAVAPIASASTGKVWIVDDDAFILEFCSRIMEQNNIEYCCFKSASEILNTPWDSDVKYILVDIRMPEMNGVELCSRLRKNVPAETMIYALTAQAMPDENTSFLQHGFNGLLVKPFKESELMALIKKDSQRLYNVHSHPGLNIKAIEDMTFGDPNEIAKLLIRFAEDSLNDVEELYAGINEHKIETVLLLTHRIAGRIAQAGASDLAKSFRLAELELRRDKMLTEKRARQILSLASKLHDLAITTRRLNIKKTIS